MRHTYTRILCPRPQMILEFTCKLLNFTKKSYIFVHTVLQVKMFLVSRERMNVISLSAMMFFIYEKNIVSSKLPRQPFCG